MNPEAWTKYPGETKLVGKDWSIDLLEGDTIAGVPTIAISSGSTVTCTFVENEGNISKFWLGAGSEDADTIPEVTLTIETTLEETLQDVIQVKVIKY